MSQGRNHPARALLVVQPWFGDTGHPAQSLLHFARAFAARQDIEYLISRGDDDLPAQVAAAEALRALAPVRSFRVNAPLSRRNTLKALVAILQLRLGGTRFETLFFFDASLDSLARHWSWARRLAGSRRLCALHMSGPEFLTRQEAIKQRLDRLLGFPEFTLYLRTEELAASWRSAFPHAKGVRVLPSIEIPEGDPPSVGPREPVGGLAAGTPRFGILGQIRPGKSIEWLVPAFRDDPRLGQLSVAGEFNAPDTASSMAWLADFPGFERGFMGEHQLLQKARAQDYLLMLYDADPRVESAVLYLAARALRPVLVLGGSWTARMVQTYGCGIIVSSDRQQALHQISTVPRPDSQAYAQLVRGLAAFRAAHTVAALQPVLAEELLA